MAAKALNQRHVAPIQNTTHGVVITPQSDDRGNRSCRSSDRKRSRDCRSRSRSYTSRRSDSYSDREPEQNGAKCFTRRVRETRMPKGFKLTSEQPKYTGKQEPTGWLEDYKLAVSCQRGTNTPAMQYIQLMLQGTARV